MATVSVVWSAALSQGCSPPAHEELRVEIGTGLSGLFEEVADGDTLDLVRGCQGLQHVWLAARGWRLDNEPPLVEGNLTRARDGVPAAAQLRVRVPFDEVPGGGYAEIGGLTLIVEDPALVLGEELLYEVAVTDSTGRVASDARVISVDWGGGCSD